MADAELVTVRAYLTIEPDRSLSGRVVRAEVVKATQNRPRVTGADSVVVLATLRLPRSLFDPVEVTNVEVEIAEPGNTLRVQALRQAALDNGIEHVLRT